MILEQRIQRAGQGLACMLPVPEASRARSALSEEEPKESTDPYRDLNWLYLVWSGV